MDTNVFHSVLMIAECRSISAAARRLFVSQPALTKQLGKLEAELGFQVFSRGRSSMSATDQGVIFLDFARQYLELEENFHHLLLAEQDIPVKPVRVATTHRGGNYAGGHTAAFLDAHPQIPLEYLDMSAEDCEAALEEETVDLAIYTDPVISPHLEYMPLEEDPLIFVVPKGSRLLDGIPVPDNSLEHLIPIDIDRFRDPAVRYILSTPGHSLYLAECAFFKKYKITPVQPLRVDFVDTRYSIACGGGGIVLIPYPTIKKVEETNQVAYCTLKDDSLYRYVIVAKKKGRQLSKEAEAVWRFMVGQKFLPIQK